MRMTKLIGWGSGALVILVAGAAVAASLPSAAARFARADSDGNGSLTPAEFLPGAERRFTRMDANGDGTISAEELDASLKAAMEKSRARILAKLDTNRDGAITRQELDNVMKAKFDAADGDRSGTLTLAELDSYRAAQQAQRAARYVKQP